MSACKTLLRISLSSYERRTGRGLSSLSRRNLPFISASLRHLFSISPSAVPNPIHLSSGFLPVPRVSSRTRRLALSAVSLADGPDETLSSNSTDVPPKDTVAELLASPKDVGRLMKMERRFEIDEERGDSKRNRWFPYLDQFRSGDLSLTSFEVLEALDPYILDARKERIRKVVESRSYSVCLVVEGLRDFGNVSAALRSADALGFQSVHVVSCDSSKRYRDNRHVSMGAEKWLDIEIWNSTQECFKVLKSRGYRIATTHVGLDAVSVYDMDWACPTAIVVGNEHEGISDEALQLSDLHCSIPMNGMVDSFNVSVAAGILMHHAVCDRISRLGCHGDLTVEERQILLAEFSLRHSKNATSIAVEYANRKLDESIFNIS